MNLYDKLELKLIKLITLNGQTPGQARVETKKFLDSHKMNGDNIRSIDSTIGYLDRNKIKIKYKMK